VAVMGETLMDRFSDRGSIPLASIIQIRRWTDLYMELVEIKDLF